MASGEMKGSLIRINFNIGHIEFYDYNRLYTFKHTTDLDDHEYIILCQSILLLLFPKCEEHLNNYFIDICQHCECEKCIEQSSISEIHDCRTPMMSSLKYNYYYSYRDYDKIEVYTLRYHCRKLGDKYNEGAIGVIERYEYLDYKCDIAFHWGSIKNFNILQSLEGHGSTQTGNYDHKLERLRNKLIENENNMCQKLFDDQTEILRLILTYFGFVDFPYDCFNIICNYIEDNIRMENLEIMFEENNQPSLCELIMNH